MLLSSRAGLEVMFPRYVLAYNVHAIVTAVGTAIYIYLLLRLFEMLGWKTKNHNSLRPDCRVLLQNKALMAFKGRYDGGHDERISL